MPIPVDSEVTDNLRKRHCPSFSSSVVFQTQGNHRYYICSLILLDEKVDPKELSRTKSASAVPGLL